MHHYTKAEVKVLIVSKSSSELFRSLFFSLSMKFSATNLIFTWKLFRQEYFCVIRICGRKFVLLVHGKACDEHFAKFIKYSHHTNIEAVVIVGGRFSSTGRHQVVVAQSSDENKRWRWIAEAAFFAIHETEWAIDYQLFCGSLRMRRTVRNGFIKISQLFVRKVSFNLKQFIKKWFTRNSFAEHESWNFFKKPQQF